MNAFEDVEHRVSLGTELSAVEHIEEVHHHVGLEHKCVVLQVEGWHSVSVDERRFDQVVTDSEHRWPSEEKDEHDDSLVECLRSDCSPHEWGEDFVSRFDAFGSELGWVWSLSRKSDSG